MTAKLELKGLVKEYVPGKPVLRGIDLSFEGAALTAIIGPSGTGKSTLIRCINRLVEPTSGAVLLDGNDLVKLIMKRRMALAWKESSPLLFPTFQTDLSMGASITTLIRL